MTSPLMNMNKLITAKTTVLLPHFTVSRVSPPFSELKGILVLLFLSLKLSAAFDTDDHKVIQTFFNLNFTSLVLSFASN